MTGRGSRRGGIAAFTANATNSQKQERAAQQPAGGVSVDYPVTGATQPSLWNMDILKPYLLLACAAFTIGFVGYWGLGRALAPAYAAAPAYSHQGPITTSTPDPALADGKHI